MEDFTKEFIKKEIKKIDTGGNCSDMVELIKTMINHIGGSIDGFDLDYSNEIINNLDQIKKDITTIINENR